MSCHASKTGWFPLLCVFLSFFLFCGCGEKKDKGIDAGSDGTPFGVAPGAGTPQGFKFPHPENTATPEIHGVWVGEAGTALCLGCHKIDHDENTVAPFCRSCHSLWPHEENWIAKEKHGDYVAMNGRGNCQTMCHGPDLLGGLSKVACRNCHHTAGWAEAANHGAAAEGDGKLACRACHGDDYLGGRSLVSCLNCHPNYPHNWERHGPTVQRDGESACSTLCHGTDRMGGLSGVACGTCHHTAGWAEAANHGPTAVGDGKLACRSCHGDDLRGGITGVSCFNPVCHNNNYPHQSGWRERNLHGAFVLSSGKDVCGTRCHGTDFAGGLSNVACNNPDCHEYPHTDPAWLGVENPVHGQTFVQKLRANAAQDCTVCHGTNFDRPLDNGQCINVACHGAGFGHPADADANWNTGEGHGRFLAAGGFRSINASACFTCHGRPISFQQSDTREFLNSQSDCYRCHWAYPHIGWTGELVTLNWERGVPACLQNPVGRAHRDEEGYLQWSPLMMVSDGVRLNQTDSDDVHLTAFTFTCGRENGFCHFGGMRSFNRNLGTSYCDILCHSPTFPASSVLPDCEPPAERQLLGAPRVITREVTPRNNATNVSRNLSRVDIRFNEPMRRETILAPGVFYLQKDSDSSMISAIVSCSADWCIDAHLGNFAALDFDTRYSVHVTAAAMDWGGAALTPFVSSFRTAPIPIPTVRSPTPTGTIYTDNPIIRATFNRNVRCPEGSECMILKRVRDNHIYNGFTSCSGRTCTFTTSGTITSVTGCDPEGDVSCAEIYEVTATTAIQSTEGYPLASDYIWQFSVDIEW